MSDVFYSLNGSYPAPLPGYITPLDGFNRTPPYSPEHIAEAGFAVAPPEPEYDPATHQLGWADGNWTVEELPPPTAPSLTDYRRAIQSCLDAKAQERNYDDGHTIATYVNSTIQGWAAEAQAFVAWRDAVWVYAFTEMAKVESGEREAPTPEQFCS